MTRETKIGLLIALAFVIAVGVLLSDHMVNNSDAKPAPVAVAGPEVGKGLAVPGKPAEGVATPITPELNPTPVNPVPGIADLAPAGEAPKTSIVVGGGPAKTDETEIAKAANPNIPTKPTEIIIKPPVENLVAEPGTHVSTLGGVTAAPAPVFPPLVAPATQPAEKKYQDYVAVAGDNVAKWAKKFLGADTKTNRDLIIAANDVLKKDPTKIVVGKTYRIPLKATPAPTEVAIAPATQPTKSTAVTPPAPAPAKTYVVKSGDNLWKIAKGNAKLASEIRKLNRDAFKGENLKVGATLRLPANAG